MPAQILKPLEVDDLVLNRRGGCEVQVGLMSSLLPSCPVSSTGTVLVSKESLAAMHGKVTARLHFQSVNPIACVSGSASGCRSDSQ